MVNADAKNDNQEATETKPLAAPSHTAKVIKPLEDQTVADVGKEASQGSTVETESSDKSKITEDEKPAEDAPANDDSKVPQSDTSAVVDAVAEQVETGKRKGNELSKEEKARAEVVQKLVAEKKYFLPLGHGHNRHKRLALPVVLLVILLSLVGVYLAIDAGLLDIGMKLPVEIIKN